MKKAEYVDPVIGTVGDEQDESFHGGGKTHPGACLPGGMVQLSPDTVTGGDNGTGYNYCHNTIEGFSFNHMSGIGWYGDLGNLQIMPVTGQTDLRSGSNEWFPLEKGKDGWKSGFSHDNETAQAGYYCVKLDRYNILAETTVREHSGFLRVTYPEKEEAKLIFNFSRRIGGRADFQSIEIADDRHFRGTVVCTPKGGGFGRGHGNISYNYNFVCELSVPAKEMRFFSQEELKDASLTGFSGEDTGLLISFGNAPESPVVVKCAVSYVDIEGAGKNFAAECENADFDAVRSEALEKWNVAFKGIDVEGTDETDKKIFYTCLYHTLLDPRTAMDVDGRFTIGKGTEQSPGYTHRTVFSGWDVYRSEFPLLTLMNPSMVNDEVNSLLKIAESSNASFPRWELLGIDAKCMVGDPGLIVVADAFVKGIRNYDVRKAYEIAKASALCSKELFSKPFSSTRPDCEEYKKDAFVPEKLSDTLEFLLADYTLSEFARALGEKEDCEFFLERTKKYKENYNKLLGFMAPRKKNGRFVFEWGRYGDNGTVESNIFQQSWFVPYDVKGLAELFGEKRTLKLLEIFFKKAKLSALWNNDYNHSNEPCHNITHYFSILGKPDRTQYWTRKVQKEAYRTGAFGFCGNEDVGQLSAWYVLSSFGFAQVCPAEPKYYINTPLFSSMSMNLDRQYHSCSVSDVLKIECDKNPLDYPYIRAVRLNGEKVTREYLTYDEITAGGTVSFELSDKPENSFG